MKQNLDFREIFSGLQVTPALNYKWCFHFLITIYINSYCNESISQTLYIVLTIFILVKESPKINIQTNNVYIYLISVRKDFSGQKYWKWWLSQCHLKYFWFGFTFPILNCHIGKHQLCCFLLCIWLRVFIYHFYNFVHRNVNLRNMFPFLHIPSTVSHITNGAETRAWYNFCQFT